MSGHSQIKRARTSLSGVNGSVARLAKRNAIRELKAKLRVGGEGQDVVGVEVAASRIPAFLTNKVVSRLHVVGPSFGVECKSFRAPLSVPSIDVGRTILATKRHRAYGTANLCPNFRAYRAAFVGSWPSLPLKTHGRPCGLGVRLSLEGANTPLPALPHLNAPAIQTFCRTAIVTRPVGCKIRVRLPSLAKGAALFTCVNPRSIFALGHPDHACRAPDRSGGGLSHG